MIVHCLPPGHARVTLGSGGVPVAYSLSGATASVRLRDTVLPVRLHSAQPPVEEQLSVGPRRESLQLEHSY